MGSSLGYFCLFCRGVGIEEDHERALQTFSLCAFYIFFLGCRSALAELQPINFLSVELDLGFSVALLSSVAFNALSRNEICNNGLLVLNMKFQL